MADMPPEMLRALVQYDPKTGAITWRARPAEMFRTVASWKMWNTRFSGKPAFASSHPDGYRSGEIFGRAYLAHRVAWAVETGAWPAHDIDHRDGQRSNNRFLNLRNATRAENSRNRQSHANSTSGYLGVSRHSASGKWAAQITASGKKEHIGLFASEVDAARAYDATAIKHFGQFARLNFPDEILTTFALRVEGVEV